MIVTSAVGSESSRTVNVAVPPPSSVVRTDRALTVIPAVSLSVFVAGMSGTTNPSYIPSALLTVKVIS